MQLLIEADEVKRQKTELKLAGIKNLPSIPKVIFDVTKLLNAGEPSAHALSGVIIKDPGLTTKLLAIANSPLYGIKRKVSSLEFAILVLGFQEIKNIVTALSIADSFKIASDKNFSPLDFWIHSMVTGSAAKGISQHLGFDFGSDAFVAGALHDMGILVIHKFFNPEFQEIASADNILKAEYDILGMSHQETGRYLAEKWQLPLSLCDALLYHHRPSESQKNAEFVSVIHLVDYMTKRLNTASFYWDKQLEFDEEVLSILNFKSAEELDDFIEGYAEMFSVTAAAIHI